MTAVPSLCIWIWQRSPHPVHRLCNATYRSNTCFRYGCTLAANLCSKGPPCARYAHLVSSTTRPSATAASASRAAKREHPASGERNSKPAVLEAKLENTQRICRIDSRHVPPNRSLSLQHYQLGDAAATAPHVLNRGIQSPSTLKTWPRADVLNAQAWLQSRGADC